MGFPEHPLGCTRLPDNPVQGSSVPISGRMGYGTFGGLIEQNSDQKKSPAYRLAALDPDFLLSDSMRGVRLQLEYEKAEERLRAWGVRSTIGFFGGARGLPG